MDGSAPPPTKRETLNIRIRAADRGLIDQAAALTGKTRTDFMLDSARIAAENALLDRTLYLAEPGAHAEFLRRLDAAPLANDRLKKTLRTAPPWS